MCVGVLMIFSIFSCKYIILLLIVKWREEVINNTITESLQWMTIAFDIEGFKEIKQTHTHVNH